MLYPSIKWISAENSNSNQVVCAVCSTTLATSLTSHRPAMTATNLIPANLSWNFQQMVKKSCIFLVTRGIECVISHFNEDKIWVINHNLHPPTYFFPPNYFNFMNYIFNKYRAYFQTVFNLQVENKRIIKSE